MAGCQTCLLMAAIKRKLQQTCHWRGFHKQSGRSQSTGNVFYLVPSHLMFSCSGYWVMSPRLVDLFADVLVIFGKLLCACHVPVLIGSTTERFEIRLLFSGLLCYLEEASLMSTASVLTGWMLLISCPLLSVPLIAFQLFYCSHLPSNGKRNTRQESKTAPTPLASITGWPNT